jgi:hypothetical protein
MTGLLKRISVEYPVNGNLYRQRRGKSRYSLNLVTNVPPR